MLHNEDPNRAFEQSIADAETILFTASSRAPTELHMDGVVTTLPASAERALRFRDAHERARLGVA